MPNRLRTAILLRRILPVFALILPYFAWAEGPGPIRIADEEVVSIGTAHPYLPAERPGGTAWTKTFSKEGASYIAVHFSRFELAEGDQVVLRDPAGRYRHVYTGRGLREKGGPFWGLTVLGDTMIVELITRSTEAEAYGFEIDRWAHGYPLENTDGPEPDALCGAEDFKDVECYRDSYPTEFEISRATVRLIKNGASHCTGWIASCENHIITNEHCVGSQAELDTIEFQFLYQRPSCGAGSPTVDLQLQGGTLLEFEAGLDYALIMPALAGNDPQATYGFMKWDVRLPDIDEVMYIPGHPSGDPKRLSLESTAPQDQSGRCEVFSVDEPACTGAAVPDIGYYCDTEGGSSGSPVISANSHAVIALHHCANCPNRGVPIIDVYNAIQSSSNPLPACVTCEIGPEPQNLVTSVPADSQVQLDWTAQADALSYDVYRSTDGCDMGMTWIAETTSNTYLDENVGGGVTYYYRVSATNDCGAESAMSNCASATPGGSCLEAPAFDGIVTAKSSRASRCGVDLGWNPATAVCGSVRYNVYRSLTPGFEPTEANRIARCISGTSMTDYSALSFQDYYYIVRAEDDSGQGAGPCAQGNEDGNTAEETAFATGPEIVFHTDDFDSGGAGWTMTGEWLATAPQGRGGEADGGVGSPDPSSAYSGTKAMTHDATGLGSAPGNYEANLETPEFAISPVIDASERSNVTLRFQRWLNVHSSPADRATIEVFDGAGWTEVWVNPTSPLYDTEWTLFEVDVSALLAGKSNARVRFSQTSNGDEAVAAGWNIDDLELFDLSACDDGTTAVSPVPDGRFVAGTPMTARKDPLGGPARVSLQWDATSCSAPSYHLLIGDSDEVASYGYSAAACSISTSGEDTVTIADPTPGTFRWWVIVGADRATEGLHGFDSSGAARPATADGLCALADQSQQSTCP